MRPKRTVCLREIEIAPFRAETTLTKHFFPSLSYVCYGYNFKISEVHLSFGMSIFYGKKTSCQEDPNMRRIPVNILVVL